MRAVRMRLASVSSRALQSGRGDMLTGGESPFQNAKLRRFSLIAYKTLADVTARGSLFIVTLVAARRLSPWEFGVFGLGTTIGWMLAVATDFGVQMHLARAVAQAPGDARALLARWWRVRLLTATSGLGLLVVALAAFGARRALGVPVVLLALVYAVTSLVELINYFYRGLSRSDIESTLTLWQRVATLAFGVGALLWRPSVAVLAAALLVPPLAALTWSAQFAMRTGRASAPPADSFIRDVFPIGLGIVLSALYFRVDVLLVQFWLGTEAVAGYNAVFRLIDALRLFPAAALAVVLPSLCRADDLRPLVQVSAAVTAFAVVAAALLWAVSDRVVTLAFGEHYRTAVPAFRILALAFPLLSLNFALTHQLIGWNRQHAYAAIAGAALVANLALNAWLIPALSIEGAAWATLGTELCVTSGCLVALRARG
jgi:O-antigen/teichoic acid export membrane protein